MVLGDLALHSEGNRERHQPRRQKQSCRLPFCQVEESSARRHPRARGLWGLRTQLRLPRILRGTGAGKNQCGHQTHRNLHEQRRPGHRTRVVLVELRLSLSTFEAALGYDRRGAAVHPPRPRWQLFMGRWPRLADFLENHVQGRKRKNRLVLHAHAFFNRCFLMAAPMWTRSSGINWPISDTATNDVEVTIIPLNPQAYYRLRWQ